MQFNLPLENNKTILALGAESAGNFSVFYKGTLFLSSDFGDLLIEKNWLEYQKAVLNYLNQNNLQPDVILSDLHPLFKTTYWGNFLASQYSASYLPIQHHLAHLCSAIGDKFLTSNFSLPILFYGIASDGTGYGLDEKIWGGEIFKIQYDSSSRNKKLIFTRIGHLENQFLIGGDLAIQEPARMLLGILAKIFFPDFLNSTTSKKIGGKEKKKFYIYFKKYYSFNELELFLNQLQQKFNCPTTSSTGRILDATSLFLGFCSNKRNYKHEPIDKLEKNSSLIYKMNLEPKITSSINPNINLATKYSDLDSDYILDTTYLFRYLLQHFSEDKKHLASLTQIYLAQGFLKIIKKYHSCHIFSSQIDFTLKNIPLFLAGGMADNKLIASYLVSQGVYAATKIPRGDASISFGQVIYYLLNF